jgi:hypothetical protein
MSALVPLVPAEAGPRASRSVLVSLGSRFRGNERRDCAGGAHHCRTPLRSTLSSHDTPAYMMIASVESTSTATQTRVRTQLSHQITIAATRTPARKLLASLS